ncbi:MAG TPA: BlaI/MecI/CopY family transcriptional regulator [Rhizomicrobium sp.]|nr:BlaI/MecI/CopY family transcriptional regulator [Rhizomicrobium sp.]
MPPPKLSKLELRIMEALWDHGPSSIREIQERFPARSRPAYTTVQTTVGRLEVKKALGRVKKIGGAHIYDALVSRANAQSRLIDEFLALFGGRAQPIMAHFVEAGKLNLEDIRRVERHLRELAAQNEKEKT